MPANYTVKLAFIYEPVGENTKVTVQLVDNPGTIFALELFLTKPDGATYVINSIRRYENGGTAGFNDKNKVLRFLYYKWNNPSIAPISIKGDNPYLLSFEITGEVFNFDMVSIGGATLYQQNINDYTIVQPVPTDPIGTSTPSPKPTSVPTPIPIIPGDVTGTGKVNIDDILLVRDVIFGITELTVQVRLNLGLGPDDAVTIDHILLIRDVIFGVE